MATSSPKEKSKVTMKDVAKHAGVSQSTVSFVLNNVVEVSIGADTRQRVLDAAEALNYRRRPQGLTKPLPGTPVIGLIVDEIATSPFPAITIEAAQEAAWSQGHILEVIMTGEDREYESAALANWVHHAKDISGIIYFSVLTRSVTPPPELSKLRCVLVNCHSDQTPFPAIIPSEFLGGFAATEALIKKGYRRIACICGEMWTEAARDRLAGYRNALTTYNIAVQEGLIREGNFLPSGGYQQTLALLSEGEPPDAIFCGNDFTAIGCYEALKEQHLRIPDDVAVMGYDDVEIAQHLNPSLSTVLLPHREMGQRAIDLLLSPPHRSKRAIKLECPVVLRESI